MKAYLYVPFQQSPAVLGKVTKEHVNFISLNCVPPDLPTDWYRDDRLKVYAGYWVDDDLFAIGMTVRGGVDHEGRENPLSHVILSDDDEFLINPISSMVALSKFVTDGTDVNMVALDSIVSAPGPYLESERTMQDLINSYDRDFLLESMSALVRHPVVYVFYDKVKPMDFLNFVRLAYIVTGPLLQKKLSFVSTIGEFTGDDIWTLIRGFPVDPDGFELTKEAKKSIDKHKGAVISLRTREVKTKTKVAKSVETMLEELSNDPWFGMSRSNHLIAMRQVLQARGMKESDNASVLARIDKLRMLKDD